MKRTLLIITVLFGITNLFGCTQAQKGQPEGKNQSPPKTQNEEKVNPQNGDNQQESREPGEKELAIYKAYEKALYGPGNPYDAKIPEGGDLKEWAEEYNRVTSRWEEDKAKEVAKQFGITAEEVKQTTYWVRDYLGE